MAFKIKSLFINSDEDEKQEEQQEDQNKNGIKFPTAPVTTPTTSSKQNIFPSAPVVVQPTSTFVPSTEATVEHVNIFVETYQKAFDALNQTGYDFFEYLQALIDNNGLDNPQMYQMAMSLGLSLDKTMTKDKLLAQADYYINEILKVHKQYDDKGKTKRNGILTQKENERLSLSNEITSIDEQIKALQSQRDIKQNQLSVIDNKYDPQIAEMDSKIIANDSAKDTIVGTINKVKSGITINVK